MADTIRVVAIEGRMLPFEGAPHRYVGWERCSEDEAEHAVPRGHNYRRTGPVEVPNTRYYRTAIARGDIADAATGATPPARIPDLPLPVEYRDAAERDRDSYEPEGR